MFSVCVEELGCKDVILVAMHHTFDQDYTLPKHREQIDPAVILLVDCLFFDKKGLLACPCNKNAVKMVRKKVITSFLYGVICWYMLGIAVYEKQSCLSFRSPRGFYSSHQILFSEDNLGVSQVSTPCLKNDSITFILANKIFEWKTV